jgi:hypothetical protein
MPAERVPEGPGMRSGGSGGRPDACGRESGPGRRAPAWAGPGARKNISREGP